MTEEANIQPIQLDFEQIKKAVVKREQSQTCLSYAEQEQARLEGKTVESGQEYWSARELATALGYSTWQKFNRVLNKALQVAQNRGMEMSEHFNQTVEMVKLGFVRRKTRMMKIFFVSHFSINVITQKDIKKV